MIAWPIDGNNILRNCRQLLRNKVDQKMDSVVHFGLGKPKKRKSTTTYHVSLEENDDLTEADAKILRIEQEIRTTSPDGEETSRWRDLESTCQESSSCSIINHLQDDLDDLLDNGKLDAVNRCENDAGVDAEVDGKNEVAVQTDGDLTCAPLFTKVRFPESTYCPTMDVRGQHTKMYNKDIVFFVLLGLLGGDTPSTVHRCVAALPKHMPCLKETDHSKLDIPSQECCKCENFFFAQKSGVKI
jgi:hypothetical protein